MKHPIPVLLALMASPALAEETRELDAHVHGVGQLNIAIDGNVVAMELHVPGADIVGFEYEAETPADLAAIEAAIETLEEPLALFGLSEAAGCAVTEAHAMLEGDEAHDHDDHDAHEHDEDHDHGDEHDHAHDDHDEDHDHGDEHDHDEAHDDDHAHDDDYAHDVVVVMGLVVIVLDHDHEHEAAGENHTEFHAEYLLTCDNIDALSGIAFAYFDTFKNALELEVQIVTSSGAMAYAVERDAPMLELDDL